MDKLTGEIGIALATVGVILFQTLVQFAVLGAGAVGDAQNVVTHALLGGLARSQRLAGNGAGPVAARAQVMLNFGQAGTVKQIYVQLGDRVKQGQVLADLDATDPDFNATPLQWAQYPNRNAVVEWISSRTIASTTNP